MDKWIKPDPNDKDKMPKEFESVLCTCKPGRVFTGFYFKSDNKIIWRDSYGLCHDIVKFWRKLPKTPKKDKFEEEE